MKTKSSVLKFLTVIVLASTSAPAFAWRWRVGPRVVVPVPRGPVVVAPGPAGRMVHPAEVQRALARRGYYHGAIDGVIGPGSRSAIRSFQASHGLAVTGDINGPLVRALGL